MLAESGNMDELRVHSYLDLELNYLKIFTQPRLSECLLCVGIGYQDIREIQCPVSGEHNLFTEQTTVTILPTMTHTHWASRTGTKRNQQASRQKIHVLLTQISIFAQGEEWSLLLFVLNVCHLWKKNKAMGIQSLNSCIPFWRGWWRRGVRRYPRSPAVFHRLLVHF